MLSSTRVGNGDWPRSRGERREPTMPAGEPGGLGLCEQAGPHASAVEAQVKRSQACASSACRPWPGLRSHRVSLLELHHDCLDRPLQQPALSRRLTGRINRHWA
jgi:hypothetical protein